MHTNYLVSHNTIIAQFFIKLTEIAQNDMVDAFILCTHFIFPLIYSVGNVQMNVDINCINAYRPTGESVWHIFTHIDVYIYISHHMNETREKKIQVVLCWI